MKKAVFFDLDGTLINSVPDVALACQKMLAELQRPILPESRIQAFLGKGARTLVARCLSNDITHYEVDKDVLEPALQLFRQYYRQHNGEKATLYPYTRETLDTLYSMGVTLALVTNKPSAFTPDLLKKFQLDHYFDLLVCGDTCEHEKPHPAPILYALETLNLTASEVVFVGDSENDTLAAQAAQMDVLLLPYGYTEGKSLSDLNPTAFIQDLRGVIDYIVQN
ncbi:phosphoglycolate phosphatase [Basilea psittacipulmonis]|uniref:Phosphoglycolate phosphatase n=1 Tax=Basilea psittacipulmonis DSM 24701 TaxID=1072685 RepID=A0A077DG66_9BURK|nr:phosphoglycolate phosphatase [Basilea psittacipulmonis]AIL32462.1 hypothetical protein IX83_03310 [Basilea psittacipulmonis DSM 24701]